MAGNGGERERRAQRPRVVAARGRGRLLAVVGAVALVGGALLWALGAEAGPPVLVLGVLALAVGLLMARFAA